LHVRYKIVGKRSSGYSSVGRCLQRQQFWLVGLFIDSLFILTCFGFFGVGFRYFYSSFS
jgi:hypothetical protein